MKVAKVNINAEVPCCSICGAIIPDCGAHAINILESNINYCYFCGHPIEWVEGEKENDH